MSTSTITTTTRLHWLLRVGDGTNLKNSSRHQIWGIKSYDTNCKHFLSEVKKGDCLWFIQNKSKGKVIAVATYVSHKKRELGPLVDVSFNNKELGWEGNENWDTEIHYDNLYNVYNCNDGNGLLTHIKGSAVIRKYNDKCNIYLPNEYSNIIKYYSISREL